MRNTDKHPQPWFAVRSLLYDERNKTYEERTVLFIAENEEHALSLAEKEALDYCNDLDGFSYMGYSDLFHLFDKSIDEGTEVFSLMRSTDMSRDEYINHFLDTGTERRRNIP